jgi:hypothetical protein
MLLKLNIRLHLVSGAPAVNLADAHIWRSVNMD